ncbi:MAG: M3 family peptidase, partial [Verrucomicrobia bacterium]|nr:M3 family peptidase [Verrucomicrobiota bacterium]
GSHEPHDNEPLTREILSLRAEKAALLDRTNFPALVLSRRMAGDPKTALAFVDDLHERTKEAFDREMEEVLDCKARHGGNREEFFPWEIAYWTERLRREKFAFDEEELRPYFALPRVMEGLFHLSGKVFGVQVQKVEDAPAAWHPDVDTWCLRDARDDRVLGYFYTDWYPREDKRGGAWMNPLLSGQRLQGGTLSPHIGVIAGNLTPPVGNKPALLTHREVETLFHEFGHLLHHLLSEVSIPGLGGTNVAWDFVELPSQIMENWCWERESLDLFARHHETGDAIPGELFRKLIASRQFGAAQFQMRQLSFAKLDLELHLLGERGSSIDFDAFAEKLLADYRPPVTVLPKNNLRSFSHLFAGETGYASGYYSYKWAEVLDADAFTRFKTEGLLNAETGRAFREAVLARGNSAPPEDLFRAFMGRDPRPQALLARLGLSG